MRTSPRLTLFCLLLFAFCLLISLDLCTAATTNPVTPPPGSIVWSSARDGGTNRIYRMNSDGSDIVRLVDEESDYPRWSPDGRWISYITPDAAFLMRPDGSGKTRIPITIDWPDWSSDSKSLIGLRADDKVREVIRCDIGTWKTTRIADLNAFAHLKDARIAKTSLAPDGRWLFVMTDRFDGGYTATNGFHRPAGAWAVAAIDLRNPAALYYVGDGCQPAAAGECLYHSRGDLGGIAQMRVGDIARKSYTTITRADAEAKWVYCPSVSTDGKWLTYVAAARHESWATGDYDVFIQPLDQPNAPRVRLAANPANDRWPDLYVGPLRLDAGSPTTRAAGKNEFVGELIATSKLPSAFSIRPYRECLMLMKYRIIDGAAGQREILVVHWGMKDLKPTPESAFKPGQKLRLTCVPFNSDPKLSRYPMANTIPESLDRDWWMATEWKEVR